MFETAFLKFVHLMLALHEFIRQWFCSFISRLPYQSKYSLLTLKSDARELKKLPIHIGILICEEDFSYTDIANIIVWSIALGISYVSVYDINGHLKRNSGKLKLEIDHRKEEILSENGRNYTIHIHPSDQDQRNSGISTICNHDYHSKNQVDIQLLSKEDGRQELVDTAQTLCRRVVSNEVRLQDITPSQVDVILQGKQHFPDPELLIKFGQGDMLFGYMPWQIRLTEILSASSHWCIEYKSFMHLLHKYGHTQQRFGR